MATWLSGPKWVTEQLVFALARGFGEAQRFPYESLTHFGAEKFIERRGHEGTCG